MTRRTSCTRVLIALGAVVLLASACGSSTADTNTAVASASTDDAGAASDSPQTQASSPATSEPEQTQPEAAAENDQDAEGDSETDDTMAGSSPVGAFFEVGGGIDSALAEYRVKVEEKIVVCMAQQGFEFLQSAPEVDEMDRLQGELSLREWTAQFGYGISTSFDSVARNQASQPNAQIFFEMSPAEREIWTEVLTGDAGIGSVLGDGGSDLPLDQQGCIGAALIETGGGEVIEGMQEFGDAYGEAEEALNDRREMIDAVDAWSRCLSGVGYPDYAERGDPEADIGERFQTIVAPLVASLGDLDAEAARSFIEGDNVELEDFPNLDADALRALQAEEVETALADLDCYEEHVQTTYEPLRDDLENGLITEFQGELEALRTIGS